jgi:uncharacterized protein (TIGR02145 family)
MKKLLLPFLSILFMACQKQISTEKVFEHPASLPDIASAKAFNNGSALTIGTQIWMNENLNAVTYRNGDKIPQVKNPAAWAGLTSGAWCWYSNDFAIGAIYGRLYNWYAVHDPRGLAPQGWHIPSDAEWTTLSTFLGGATAAGGKMKETGTTHWTAPNTNASNSSGFTGLPGGNRSNSGPFSNISNLGFWWSSTQGSTGLALARHLSYDNGDIPRNDANKQNGFSIRCVADDTVKIGSQVWMRRNLNVATYRNGDRIPQVKTPTAWAGLTTGAWCWYNNDSATYAATYGKLYNWYAIHDPRGLAPTGWHVPVDAEWATLITFLGPNATAGGKMKEAGTIHWPAPNTDATNSSGFTALPGGYRFTDGFFYDFAFIGFWWSSTERYTGAPTAFVRFIQYNNGKTFRNTFNKNNGLSVRCVKN